ncbi:MAG: hypothetical protein GPOALKHO_001965 [Sodalis sp.]|nr:MAG: hypothetical protein GPOALKHO_001965 [Sodalis sp.]
MCVGALLLAPTHMLNVTTMAFLCPPWWRNSVTHSGWKMLGDAGRKSFTFAHHRLSTAVARFDGGAGVTFLSLGTVLTGRCCYSGMADKESSLAIFRRRLMSLLQLCSTGVTLAPLL